MVVLARRRTFILTLAGVVVLSMIASVVLPKSYKAATTVVVNYKGVDPVSGVVLPSQLASGYVLTQVDIIKSRGVALQVVDGLNPESREEAIGEFMGSSDRPEALRERLADRLLKKLSVEPSLGSSVINISFKSESPRLAAAIVNGFANEYQQTSAVLKTEPMKKASEYLSQQLKIQRENMEAAQNKLIAFQKERGIVSSDKDNRIDIETTRLNDLGSQLVTVQGQLMEAESRDRTAGDKRRDTFEAVNNPLVQNLRSSLSQARARLAQIELVYTHEHPSYQNARAEVERITRELNANTRSVTNSVSNNVDSLRSREAHVRHAFEAQKARVLDLVRDRAELTAMVREVENSQRIYDANLQRFYQTSIEGRATQGEGVVLSLAPVPTKSTNPGFLVSTILAVVLGTVLALGTVLMSEMLDRRVRAPSDLMEVIQAPVLGILSLKQGGSTSHAALGLLRRPRLS